MRNDLGTLFGMDDQSIHEIIHAIPPVSEINPASLPPVAPARTEAAVAAFRELTQTWAQGFGDPNLVQPDRLTLLNTFGQSKHAYPLFREACRIGSLQAIVEDALPGADTYLIETIAGNMAQVAHAGFSELAQTLTYSGYEKWRRPVEAA